MWVKQDGGHPGFQSSDSESITLCSSNDGYYTFNPVGIGRRPFESLHASHGCSHHRIDPLHTQVIDERLLDVYKITYGDRRECHAIGLSGIRICRGGAAGNSHTVLDIGVGESVEADDKKPVGVKRPAWSDYTIPIAGETIIRLVFASSMRGPAKEGGYQDGIVARRVELSVGLIAHPHHFYGTVSHRSVGRDLENLLLHQRIIGDCR